MADISAIKLPNGTTYNLKDTTARNAANSANAIIADETDRAKKAEEANTKLTNDLKTGLTSGTVKVAKATVADSASSLGKVSTYQTGIPDNGGRRKYLLMYDITDWISAKSNASTRAFDGYFFSRRSGGYVGTNYTGNLSIVASYNGVNSDGSPIKSDNGNSLRLRTTSSTYVPRILHQKSNDKYYLSLMTGGSGRDLILFGIFQGTFIGTWINNEGANNSNGTLPSDYEEYSDGFYSIPYEKAICDKNGKDITEYLVAAAYADGAFTFTRGNGDKTVLTIPDTVSNTINTHIANKSNPHGVTKAQVGLGSVANLDQSKAIKSITRSGTTFTATALDGTKTTFTQQDSNTTYSVATSSADGLMSKSDKAKLDGIGTGSNVKSVNGKTGAVSLSKADVGLGNVDNTSDANKPYYKLIGKTATNTNKVGHFKFNDASQSLYKIKNFYAASGEGDYFYLAHKKSDYTITATKHFLNVDGLFTAGSSDGCAIATYLISESDPAILTIVRNHVIAETDALALIFYEYEDGWPSNASLNHWKLEIMAAGPNSPDYTKHTWNDGDWITVFERTNVSDSINCLWCGLNPYKNDGLSNIQIKGIRITIYAATPCTEIVEAINLVGMRLLDSRQSFSPAEALGALDVAGGTVYGKTTFQEGISATSYSGATATSSADGLMSKDDKAKLDTLVDTLYPVGSIYMSVIDKDPGTFIGGRWKRIKDCFLLAAGNKYPIYTAGGEDTHTLSAAEMPSHAHTVRIWDPQGTMGGAQGAYAATYGATLTTVPNGATTSLTWNNSTPMAAMNGMGDPAGVTEFSGGGLPHNNMPPYVTVYVWLRIDYSLDVY